MPYLCTSLTYSQLFCRRSGWIDLRKKIVRISFIQRFSGFPYLLTTFSKDVRLSWSQTFFSYLAYSPLHRISLLTTFSKDVRLSWPQTLFFVSRAYLHLIEFPYLRRPTTFSKDVRSRLVGSRSEFWHWKWLPEGVTHSNTSQTLFFRISLSLPQNRVLTPNRSLQVVTRSKSDDTSAGSVRVQRAASLQVSLTSMWDGVYSLMV